MVRRSWAGVAGGFLLGFALYILVSIFTTTPEVSVFVIGWVVLGVLIARSSMPWPNTWLFLAIASFLLPVLWFVRLVTEGASDPMVQTSDAAAAGFVIGSIAVVGTLGFVGFFLGIVFALLAFFTRRGA